MDQPGHSDPTLLARWSGASLSHNLLRRSFVRSVRAHESAIRQQAAGARDLASAEAERDAIDHQEQTAAEVRDSTIEELHKLADQLKGPARLQLAKKIGDVSATNASPENAEPLSHAERGDAGELHP